MADLLALPVEPIVNLPRREVLLILPTMIRLLILFLLLQILPRLHQELLKN